MPTGVEEGIVGGIVGAIGWITSLPDWAKYIIFVSGVAFDAGVVGIVVQNGIIGTVLSFILQKLTGIDAITISSLQVLILAVIAPVIFYVFSAYRSQN
jgi:hypothetical protein